MVEGGESLEVGEGVMEGRGDGEGGREGCRGFGAFLYEEDLEVDRDVGGFGPGEEGDAEGGGNGVPRGRTRVRVVGRWRERVARMGASGEGERGETGMPASESAERR